MAVPYQFAALSNTPQSIASAGPGEVQTIFARNPHATDGAYVKLYRSVAAPTGSSVPAWAAWVPGASDRVLPTFVRGAHWWVAVATEFAAGLTAPSTAFSVALTFESG